MTRKHFELIARTIAELELKNADHEYVAAEFMRVLAGANPQFDSARFLKACGAGTPYRAKVGQ